MPDRLSDRIAEYQATPDGRYLVVRGRLWRCSNPALGNEERATLVEALMDARRAVGAARRANNSDAETLARANVDRVKKALGERGPVWWDDGAPDQNRKMARNSTYAQWFAKLDPPDDTDEARAGPG